MRIGIVAPTNPYGLADLLNTKPADLPNINKGTPIINTLIREYIAQGHEVIVFTTSGGLDQSFSFTGGRLKIYIANSVHPFLPTAMFRVYMTYRLRCIIREHSGEFDVLHAHWTYENALAASEFTEKVPVFCSVRDWCPKILRMQTKFKELIYWILSWFVFKIVMSKRAIYFIANSPYTHDLVTSNYPNLKCSVIYNPISMKNVLDYRKNPDVNLNFVSISQEFDSYWKNYSKLLDGFYMFHQQHPKSKLTLIGNGSIDTSIVLRKKHQEGKLDGVELRGFMSHDELFNVLDESFCLIHPSLEETFGNVLLEAMSRCVPVIGGIKSGAVPHVLGYGQRGVLCDVTSAKAIFDSMNYVLSQKESANQLSRNATSFLKENYAVDIIIRNHISLYNEALASFSK